MSAPIKTTRMPQRIIDVAAYIQERTDPLILQFDSAKEAFKHRREIYGYRATMEKEGLAELYPRFIACEISCTEDGKLIIRAKDDTKLSHAINDALDKANFK